MSDTHKCITCENMVVKRFGHFMPRGNWTRSVYIDDKGHQWNGNQCPDCKNSIKSMKLRISKRLCRRCLKPLAVNYFFHPQCLDLEERYVGYVLEETAVTFRPQRRPA